MNIETELVELVEAVLPSLIDIEQLERLVTEDESADAFDGECAAHDGCIPIFARRLQ